MPQFITGNLWDAQADVIAITTNAMVRADGALVMGRGAAKEAIERYPQLPFAAGRYIQTHIGSCGSYGWLVFATEGKRLGLFQVKHHWQQQANLDLIRLSAMRLRNWLEQHDGVTVALNYPGIGNGRLQEADVVPLLAVLPDSVTIYRKGDNQ